MSIFETGEMTPETVQTARPVAVVGGPFGRRRARPRCRRARSGHLRRGDHAGEDVGASGGPVGPAGPKGDQGPAGRRRRRRSGRTSRTGRADPEHWVHHDCGRSDPDLGSRTRRWAPCSWRRTSCPPNDHPAVTGSAQVTATRRRCRSQCRAARVTPDRPELWQTVALVTGPLGPGSRWRCSRTSSAAWRAVCDDDATVPRSAIARSDADPKTRSDGFTRSTTSRRASTRRTSGVQARQPPRLSRSSCSSWRRSATSALSSASSARAGRRVSAARRVRGGRRASPRRCPCAGGDGGVGGGDQRRGPALLLLPGPAADVVGQRLVARAQQVELVLYLVEPVEVRHALGPDAQLADRLRAPQQEHGQDGALAVVEAQRLVEHLAVADDRAAVRGQHEADQLLVLELVERGEHRRLVVADDRLPVRGLVAGGLQGVDGEGVLLGSRQALLDQRAQHPGALRAQLHATEHTHQPGPETSSGAARYGPAVPEAEVGHGDRAGRTGQRQRGAEGRVEEPEPRRVGEDRFLAGSLALGVGAEQRRRGLVAARSERPGAARDPDGVAGLVEPAAGVEEVVRRPGRAPAGAPRRCGPARARRGRRSGSAGPAAAARRR